MPSQMPRECAQCYFVGTKSEYSSNQWRKGEGVSKCPGCAAATTGGGYHEYSSSSDDEYDYYEQRECRDCYFTGGEEDYSRNQWSKGTGESLCPGCAQKKCSRPVQRLKFFHGTSWARAQRIQSEGIRVSEGGLLGPGIYVAREDKARRFAMESSRHGSARGGLVEVLITFSNPKYVRGEDTCWQREGHDACRTDRTSASTNMEWCVRDAHQVQVLRIHGPFDLRTTDCPGCGKKRFANLHHAVQHIESGYCSGWYANALLVLLLLCLTQLNSSRLTAAWWCLAAVQPWRRKRSPAGVPIRAGARKPVDAR